MLLHTTKVKQRDHDKPCHDVRPLLAAAALKRAKQGGGLEGAKYDWSNESVHFESPPHRGDLAVNLAFGATILWLPLSFAAIIRAASVKYRFTDKRMSVITTSPWSSAQPCCLLQMWCACAGHPAWSCMAHA